MAGPFDIDITLSGYDAAGNEMDLQLEVSFEVSSWGCAAQVSGPPESCHPAEDPEIDEVKVLTVNGETPDEATAKALAQRVYDEKYDDLVQHACEICDDGPDPDDARDQAFDDQLWD